MKINLFVGEIPPWNSLQIMNIYAEIDIAQQQYDLCKF